MRRGHVRGTWLDWSATPRTALIPPTPPGPEGSKGTRALAGVRGVLLPAPRGSGTADPAPEDPDREGEVMTGEVPSPAPDSTVPGGPGRPGGPPPRLALYRRYRPATFAEVTRPGPRHRAAPPGAAHRPGASRLSVQRAARLRQDVQRADPGPLAELRRRAHPGPVRQVRVVYRARPGRAGQPRRDRDRRRLARRRGRRPGPARAGVLRAGLRPVQDLHHRRGAHGDPGGLQRPAQAGRGTAAAPQVRLRHHRAGKGHRDDPVAHPPLPVPPGAARDPA